MADALGMKTVFVHPLAGVLSAYGMGLADVAALRERTVEQLLPPDSTTLLQLEEVLEELAASAVAEVTQQDIPRAQVKVLRKLLLRYQVRGGWTTKHAFFFLV